MEEESFDLLCESLVLPEDLQDDNLNFSVGEEGFPTRAYVLPDELRGALLLPSNSGSFSTSHCTGETSLDMGSYGSELRISQGLVGLASNSVASSGPRGLAAVSPDGVSQGSSGKAACSFKSSGDRSGAWSLSDTDLRELLERATPIDNGVGLSTVPESGRIAALAPLESSSARASSARSVAVAAGELVCGMSAHGSSPPSFASKCLSSQQQQQQHSRGTLSGSSHPASGTPSVVPAAGASPPMSSPSASLAAQSISNSLASPSQAETSLSSGSKGSQHEARYVVMRSGASAVTAVARGSEGPWSGAIRSQAATQSSATRGSIGGSIEADIHEVSIGSSSTTIAEVDY